MLYLFIINKNLQIQWKKYNIKSNINWRNFIKENSKKLKLPTNPEIYYKNKGWNGWYDWLNKKREN